jgi:fructokinase
VLVTRGGCASMIVSPWKSVAFSAPRVEVADTVGAGDASIGGFLFSLMTAPQRTWQEHLAFALAAGAAACRHAGAHSPSLDEVVALLEG